MTSITDFKPTVSPVQGQIAVALGSAGPAQLINPQTVSFLAGNRVIQVVGEGLEVSKGLIVAGNIQGIEFLEALTPVPEPYPYPLPYETPELSAGLIEAPIVYDPRISSVSGLDWSARLFNFFLDEASEGNTAPFEAALTRGGVLYRDSHYDNVAKGGRGDDLFRDLGGSDTYIGGSGTDTVSYEFSVIDPGVIVIGPPVMVQPGSDGITADLRLGTVQNAGFAPPVFLTAETGELTRPTLLHQDTLRGIENLTGSNFDDRILGDRHDNVLEGLDGDDRIAGRGGDDLIRGGDGDDRLAGNRGDDVIISGDGRDVLRGGPGADDFVFELFEDGRNVIRDFNPDEGRHRIASHGARPGYPPGWRQRGDPPYGYSALGAGTGF